MESGLLDNAPCGLFIVNFEDVSQGKLILLSGTVREIETTATGKYTIEIAGYKQLLEQSIGDIVQPECRADLGDAKCKFPIDPPVIGFDSVGNVKTEYAVGEFGKAVIDPDLVAVAGSPDTYRQYQGRIFECIRVQVTPAQQLQGKTTGTIRSNRGGIYDNPNDTKYDTQNEFTDGQATFIWRWAFFSTGVVSNVASAKRVFTLTFDDLENGDLNRPNGFFNQGVCEFVTGENKGLRMEIKNHAGSTITLWDAMPGSVTSNDRVILIAGCDKQLETCKTKFSIDGSPLLGNNGNVLNYRGEPFLPGRDRILVYPDR